MADIFSNKMCPGFCGHDNEALQTNVSGLSSPVLVPLPCRRPILNLCFKAQKKKTKIKHRNLREHPSALLADPGCLSLYGQRERESERLESGRGDASLKTKRRTEGRK